MGSYNGVTALSSEEVERVMDLHRRGFSAPKIAAIVRRHVSTVRQKLHENGVPKRPAPNSLSWEPTVDPTPAELAERIAEVQATWSPRERLKRMVCRPTDWRLPVVSDPHLERKAG